MNDLPESKYDEQGRPMKKGFGNKNISKTQIYVIIAIGYCCFLYFLNFYSSNLLLFAVVIPFIVAYQLLMRKSREQEILNEETEENLESENDEIVEEEEDKTKW